MTVHNLIRGRECFIGLFILLVYGVRLSWQITCIFLKKFHGPVPRCVRGSCDSGRVPPVCRLLTQHNRAREGQQEGWVWCEWMGAWVGFCMCVLYLMRPTPPSTRRSAGSSVSDPHVLLSGSGSWSQLFSI